MITIRIEQVVYEYQEDTHHPKPFGELAYLTPLELQFIKTTLKPQELLEQVHFTLKVKIIINSKRLNKKIKDNQKNLEYRINQLNTKLQSQTITEQQQ